MAIAGLAAQEPAAKPIFADEVITVSTEHPRLFLRPQRLRLLRRERERSSARWQLFESLVSGSASMDERAYATALYYQVSRNAEAGQDAITLALTPAADLRQQALVFDWCQDLLTDAQKKELAARLQRGISGAPPDDVAATRSRALAAIALFDHVEKVPRAELERIVHQWWEGKMVPALRAGRAVIGRDDAYPLYELLHSVRDSTNLDLRESYPQFFKDYPIEHLITHYPETYEAPDQGYRIGFSRKTGPPDLKLAALSRASELAMVAYDANAPDSQVLQGWLMHDRYVLRGPYGSPYEFLWANPYQPGLSYYLVPLIYHNTDFGKLIVRSSWDEDAKWLGITDGVVQMYEGGKATLLDPKRLLAPLLLTEAVVSAARKFQVTLEDEDGVFVVGLEPKRLYQVEIDDEEMYETAADVGGILEIDPPHGKPVGVRIREAPTTKP